MINDLLLLKNLSASFETNHYSKDELKINDIGYNSYLNECNGGYYFDHSMVLYGLNTKEKFNNASVDSNLVKKYYNPILGQDLFCFGADIFGNLFVFGESEKVLFFNIESGEIEQIANDFEDWLKVLFSDLNYFSGRELAMTLTENVREDLSKGFRLCPKIPFITGGAYDLSNLYLKFYDINIKYNASIASQVINLEDGQAVKIKLIQ